MLYSITKQSTRKSFGVLGFYQAALCFFCKRVVQGFVVLLERCQKRRKRDSCKRVVQECFVLPERCQKLCNINSFKRVVQECFLQERCPELHNIYECPDSCAKERFTFFCFF